MTEQSLDNVDVEPLKHLKDVWIEHDDKDVREYEVTFVRFPSLSLSSIQRRRKLNPLIPRSSLLVLLQTFSPKNPYFKETQIKKRVTVTPPKSSEEASETPGPYDLDAPLFLLPSSPITWTSDEHNLIKKAPKVNVLELEQFDEFEGSAGSFFNWFTQEGEDDIGLAEYLLEWWSHATEYVLILLSLSLVPILN